MSAFEKLFLVNSEKKFYVEYINKADKRHGTGYYCNTRKEAEAQKAVMEKAWGAELWDVVIVEE